MRNLIMVVLVMCAQASAFGQIKATTEDGKEVILREDWTWKYAEVQSETETKAFSLDCSDLIKTEVDKMTGKSNTAMANPMILSDDNKTGLAINLIKGKSTTIFRLIAFGGGCIDDEGKANFLFRDGTKLEMMNRTDFNCDGDFHIYLGGAVRNIKKVNQFLNKEIETIRIWTRKSYVQRDLDEFQSKELMAAFNCIMKKN